MKVRAIADRNGARDVAVVVGPEGGLAPGERAALEENGARPVSLGDTVLRTETADAVTARDLQKHLKNEIDAGALHQRAILTRVAWAEALPRTSVGKIDKKALRARLAAAAGTVA